ncbi:competence protein CoiA [Lederbergia graminis]|uniref:Competence protein CoiA n=1 Tax=Lederbergia graminis TaxID=735518 RepID=A0ABW0LE68_9BACI
MLTAYNENGNFISLAGDMSPQQIRSTLQNQNFYCPICKERVILKVGEIRIPHFSHLKFSNCSSSVSEPESHQHLQGKKQLFTFFKSKVKSVYLEVYLPTIKQRPDIFIKQENHSYAIEFQCSPISRDIIRKRTNGYLSAGIIPIWIIGGLPFQQQYSKNFFRLSDFQWSFVKQRGNSGLSSISYDPSDEMFHYLTGITSLTSRKIAASYQVQSLNGNSYTRNVFHPKSLNVKRWIQEKNNWLQTKVYYGNLKSDPFLKNVYIHKHHPFHLPPIIGIPTLYKEYFHSHPVEWQFYTYLDSLKNIKIGQTFSLKYVHHKIENRIRSGHIIARDLPLEKEQRWKEALAEYIHVLSKLEYFDRKGIDLFEKKRNILIPQTMEQLQKQEESLYRNISFGHTSYRRDNSYN